MSLPHALLTALIDRPCSGLELAERFSRSIGYFWQATHQQIYKELGKMEKAGWLTASQVAGARGGKKVYAVLPAGKEELARWAGDALEPNVIRDEFLVRLRAQAVLEPTALTGRIKTLLNTHIKKLNTYQEIGRRDFSGGEFDRKKSLQNLVLQAGIELEKNQISLCERALEILDKADE